MVRSSRQYCEDRKYLKTKYLKMVALQNDTFIEYGVLKGRRGNPSVSHLWVFKLCSECCTLQNQLISPSQWWTNCLTGGATMGSDIVPEQQQQMDGGLC